MAGSEVQAIDRLDRRDLAGALALSDAAGWNQSADDWAFFIEHGESIGVRDDDGRLVATAAALPYGGAVGWISMVLVDAAHRHRGLATMLLGACVESLQRSDRVPVLDATPAGAEVYRRSGFGAGFAFERWQGQGAAQPARATGEGVARAVCAGRDDSERVVALDRSVADVDRALLLRSILARPATSAWLSADRSGFALCRAGRRASQLGPVIAADDAAGIALVATVLATTAGAVFIDVPVRRQALARALEQRGFVRQRPFVRMSLGATAATVDSERVFAVAGPEFG